MNYFKLLELIEPLKPLSANPKRQTPNNMDWYKIAESKAELFGAGGDMAEVNVDGKTILVVRVSTYNAGLCRLRRHRKAAL